MNQEILDRIDALAAKLGVTSDALWAILVRQARVEACVDIVAMMLFMCLVIVGWVLYAKKSRAGWEREDWGSFTMMGVGQISAIVVLCAASLAAIILLIFEGSSSVKALIAPEFWAYKHLPIWGGLNP